MLLLRPPGPVNVARLPRVLLRPPGPVDVARLPRVHDGDLPLRFSLLLAAAATQQQQGHSLEFYSM